MERDEKDTHERLIAGRKELFEPEIALHHGRIFKLMGDGLLAEFGSVVDAIECAVSLQRGLAERNANVPDDRRIQVRIGINLGEVIVEGDDRYGEGVNIAARLEQLSEPGGICVSGKVAREVEKKLAFGFEPLGRHHVKNIAEPVEAFRVKLDGVPQRRTVPVAAGRTLSWAAAVLAAVATLAVIGFALLKPTETPTISTAIPSIAVLPFDNMGGEQTISYLGDGVAEDIISMLARAPDLSVIARNSSFKYKGTATDVRQIGKELGVGYVLEGSVRKDSDKVRIVAQLVDTKTGEHVWAERFDKTGADPWALQDEVTGKIIAALSGEMGQLKKAQYREAWGKDTANLEEYDYYLRGHDVLMAAQTKDDYKRAQQIWHEGLQRFPNSSLLQIKLGFGYFMAAWNWQSDDLAGDYQRASELARKGLAGENLSPQTKRLGHWLMAFVKSQERDFEQAWAEAEAAAALAPYDAFMLGRLANVATMCGQSNKAIEWLTIELQRSPGDNHYWQFGWAYYVAGRYEEAIDAFKKSGRPWTPDDYLNQAATYVRLDRLDEAKAAVDQALKLDSSFTQAKWREGYFYSDPSILERQIADLGKAGLPEK
jgi:TolB-like protein